MDAHPITLLERHGAGHIADLIEAGATWAQVQARLPRVRASGHELDAGVDASIHAWARAAWRDANSP